MSKAYAGLRQQIASTQHDRGVQAGMEQAAENQKKSPTEFYRGVADGRREVTNQAPAQKKPVAAPKTEGSKPVAPGKSTAGVFSGDVDIDADL